MTERDITVLNERKRKLTAILSGQMKIKKDKRDKALIKDIESRIQRINQWKKS